LGQQKNNSRYASDSKNLTCLQICGIPKKKVHGNPHRSHRQFFPSPPRQKTVAKSKQKKTHSNPPMASFSADTPTSPPPKTAATFLREFCERELQDAEEYNRQRMADLSSNASGPNVPPSSPASPAVSATSALSTDDPESISSPLLFAVQHGNFESAILLLAAGANRKYVGPFGTTPLHAATQRGNLELVRAILSAEVDVDARKSSGDSSLHLAVQQRDGKVIVEELINSGADVNADNNLKVTPLLYAAARGHVVIAKLLVAKGANVNAVDDSKNSAMHYAAKCASTEMVKMLIEAGADPDGPK
jgi:hypothetical protein